MSFLDKIPGIISKVAAKKAAIEVAKQAPLTEPSAISRLKDLAVGHGVPMPDSMPLKFGKVGDEFEKLFYDATNDATTKLGVYSRGFRETAKGTKPEQIEEINKALNDGQHKLSTELYGRKSLRRLLLNNFHRDEIVPSGIPAAKDIGFLDNYFPREWDYTELQKYKKPGPTREAKIQELMRNSKGEVIRSFNEATDILNGHLSHTVRTKQYGPIDFHRTADMPGYKLTDDVVYNYFDKSLRRTELAKRFGVNNEKIMEMAKLLPEDQKEQFVEMANLILGPKLKKGALDEDLGLLQNWTRKEISQKYMAFSAINNLWQGPFGAAVRNDLGSALKGFVNVVRGKDKAFLDELGAIQAELSESFTKAGSNADFFTKSGFRDSEIWTRKVQGLSAKYYTKGLYEKLLIGNKAARAEFIQLGFNPDKILRNGLTRYDELKIANIMIHQTQFKAGQEFMPYFMATSPLYQTLFTMNNYNIQWFNFVRKYVWKELKDNGNPAPLVKLLGLGYMVGASNRMVWNTILGKEPDDKETVVKNVVNNIGYSGALGIMGDMLTGGLVGRSFASPAINLLNEGFQAVQKATLDRDINPALQLGSRRFLYPELVKKLPYGIGLPVAVASRHVIEKGLREKRERDAKEKRAKKNK